jgi:hypothetical protein
MLTVGSDPSPVCRRRRHMDHWSARLGSRTRRSLRELCESRHSSSTLTAYRFYWNNIVRPRCGDKLLRDFNTPSGQALLDEVARQNPTMRAGTLHKLKSILSAVFKLAIQQDYRTGPNPMRETTLPRAPGVQETHAYDLQAVRRIVALVPNTCRVVISLAAYAGLSKSEI